ncbi:MAG: DNA polymerase-1 [Chlamydiales bacterium]|jgi:DNA polymerase-1
MDSEADTDPMSANTVHLIDASPYIFRAYFALPERIGLDGQRIETVQGFAGFLLKLFTEEQPTHVGVAFDESLTTCFRNEIYPEYKAQRELPPAQLEAQLKACQQAAAAMGAAVFVHERFEADDLIGTLVAKLRQGGQRAVVVSPDKDLAQLVGPDVQLFDYARGKRYGPGEVVEKFGVEPGQITDYLGLAGDSVDNIPGVRGVGAKTAARLLGAFRNLEEIYANLEGVAALEMRGAASVAVKLEKDRDMAFLSRKLATVALDAPARATLADLAFTGPNMAQVQELCDRLGIRGLKDRIQRWSEKIEGKGHDG